MIRISKDMEEEKIHSYTEENVKIRPILEGKDGIKMKNERHGKECKKVMNTVERTS